MLKWHRNDAISFNIREILLRLKTIEKIPKTTNYPNHCRMLNTFNWNNKYTINLEMGK